MYAVLHGTVGSPVEFSVDLQADQTVRWEPKKNIFPPVQGEGGGALLAPFAE